MAIEAASRIELVPLHGDFLETMNARRLPDLIFYDMFSSKTCGIMDAGCFQKLFAVCRGRAVELVHLHLFDLGACGSARRRFLRRQGSQRWGEGGDNHRANAGGSGSRFENGHDLLSSQWLEKWNRSGPNFPPSCQRRSAHLSSCLIRAHEQFQLRR